MTDKNGTLQKIEEKNDENSSPISSLPVNCLTATDCNANNFVHYKNEFFLRHERSVSSGFASQSRKCCGVFHPLSSRQVGLPGDGEGDGEGGVHLHHHAQRPSGCV